MMMPRCGALWCSILLWLVLTPGSRAQRTGGTYQEYHYSSSSGGTGGDPEQGGSESTDQGGRWVQVGATNTGQRTYNTHTGTARLRQTGATITLPRGRYPGSLVQTGGGSSSHSSSSHSSSSGSQSGGSQSGSQVSGGSSSGGSISGGSSSGGSISGGSSSGGSISGGSHSGGSQQGGSDIRNPGSIDDIYHLSGGAHGSSGHSSGSSSQTGGSSGQSSGSSSQRWGSSGQSSGSSGGSFGQSGGSSSQSSGGGSSGSSSHTGGSFGQSGGSSSHSSRGSSSGSSGGSSSQSSRGGSSHSSGTSSQSGGSTGQSGSSSSHSSRGGSSGSSTQSGGTSGSCNIDTTALMSSLSNTIRSELADFRREIRNMVEFRQSATELLGNLQGEVAQLSSQLSVGVPRQQASTADVPSSNVQNSIRSELADFRREIRSMVEFRRTTTRQLGEIQTGLGQCSQGGSSARQSGGVSSQQLEEWYSRIDSRMRREQVNCATLRGSILQLDQRVSGMSSSGVQSEQARGGGYGYRETTVTRTGGQADQSASGSSQSSASSSRGGTGGGQGGGYGYRETTVTRTGGQAGQSAGGSHSSSSQSSASSSGGGAVGGQGGDYDYRETVVRTDSRTGGQAGQSTGGSSQSSSQGTGGAGGGQGGGYTYNERTITTHTGQRGSSQGGSSQSSSQSSRGGGGGQGGGYTYSERTETRTGGQAGQSGGGAGQSASISVTSADQRGGSQSSSRRESSSRGSSGQGGQGGSSYYHSSSSSTGGQADTGSAQGGRSGSSSASSSSRGSSGGSSGTIIRGTSSGGSSSGGDPSSIQDVYTLSGGRSEQSGSRSGGSSTSGSYEYTSSSGGRNYNGDTEGGTLTRDSSYQQAPHPNLTSHGGSYHWRYINRTHVTGPDNEIVNLAGDQGYVSEPEPQYDSLEARRNARYGSELRNRHSGRSSSSQSSHGSMQHTGGVSEASGRGTTYYQTSSSSASDADSTRTHRDTDPRMGADEPMLDFDEDDISDREPIDTTHGRVLQLLTAGRTSGRGKQRHGHSKSRHRGHGRTKSNVVQYGTEEKVKSAHVPHPEYGLCPGYVNGIDTTEEVRSDVASVMGSWFKDTGENDGRVWAVEGSNALHWTSVAEYGSEQAYKNKSVTSYHSLSEPCTGLGPVLYKGHLYCQAYASRRKAVEILKFTLPGGDLVEKATVTLMGGLRSGVPYRGWAGIYLHVQLLVDERGMYVLTGDATTRKLIIYEIDPETLTIIKTYLTKQSKDMIGPAFMSCGVLYALDSHYANYIAYVYDTNTKLGRQLEDSNLVFPHMELASLHYSPFDQQLYAWRVTREPSSDQRPGRRKSRVFGISEKIQLDRDPTSNLDFL